MFARGSTHQRLPVTAGLPLCKPPSCSEKWGPVCYGLTLHKAHGKGVAKAQAIASARPSAKEYGGLESSQKCAPPLSALHL